MAVDPNILNAEAKCYLCLGISQFEALQLALLARIADSGATIQTQLLGNLMIGDVPPDNVLNRPPFPASGARYTDRITGIAYTWDTAAQAWI